MSLEKPIVSPNFSGIKRAKVITVEDPLKKGRIGVFIPSVMSVMSTGIDKEESTEFSTPIKVDHSLNNTVNLPIKSANYVWAKPSHRYNKDNSGDFIVPTEGSIVFVIYEDDDPQKLYYLPFGPDDDDNIDISKSGSSNTSDKAKRNNIIVLHTTNKGSTIAMDANDETIYIKTAKGSKLVLKDDGSIELTSTEITLKSDIISLEASDKIEVNAGGSTPWLPNSVAVCPFAGFKHDLGITTLSGKG